MHHVDIIALGLMLLVACLVAILCRRAGLPYAIGLVVAGIGIGLSGWRTGIDLTPELIFTVLLPRWCSRRRCICAGTSFAGKRRW
jgi:CPA1 family monovalent cation:H+ antiporter